MSVKIIKDSRVEWLSTFTAAGVIQDSEHEIKNTHTNKNCDRIKNH